LESISSIIFAIQTYVLKMTYRYLPLFLLFSISMLSCKDKQQNTEAVSKEKANIDQKADSIGQSAVSAKKTIVFFGNSLTAGYGLDEQYSFPSLIQNRIDSLNLPYQVINAGLSGETTSGGKNRIDWVMKQTIDVFVLELGANDVLRGLDLKETESNLRTILQSVKEKYPNAKLVLAGMQAPANMGNTYTKTFSSIYPKLAKEFNAALIPFLLENVATIAKLNLADGKHPNADGQKIVRENVWKIIAPLLQ
jgi:acyl-CoA thioesterase I